MVQSLNKLFLILLISCYGFSGAYNDLSSHDLNEYGYVAFEISKGQSDCHGNNRLTGNIWYLPTMESVDSLFNIYLYDASDIFDGMNEQLVPKNVYLVMSCGDLSGYGLDSLSQKLESSANFNIDVVKATKKKLLDSVDTLTYPSRCFLVSSVRVKLKTCPDELKGTRLDKARNVLAFQMSEFQLGGNFVVYKEK